MRKLEKYYGNAYGPDLAIIEPFSGQQPIIDNTECVESNDVLSGSD
jgi:hypothetical protein